MVQVSIRCREMGTAEPVSRRNDPPGLHQVSIRCREMGTAEPVPGGQAKPGKTPVSIRCREMGTAEPFSPTAVGSGWVFLFAVARWGQRNPADGRVAGRARLVSIRCREMGTAELAPETMAALGRNVITGEFLFAVARWGQRNADLARLEAHTADVSIRCREMGTAEPYRLPQASGDC